MVIEPWTQNQCVKERCSHCQGKGKVTARCRCNGTGRMRDLAQSARQGGPVEPECERSTGCGFRRMPASRAFQVVTLLLPELMQSPWSRNWKPFFEKLVAKYEIEENHAEAEFRKVNR